MDTRYAMSHAEAWLFIANIAIIVYYEGGKG